MDEHGKPRKLITFEEGTEQTTPAQDATVTGEASLHKAGDIVETYARLGITYQRCGGGRRIIRRHERSY